MMLTSVTQAHSPPRLGLETCAAAGTLETQGMDGLRRPLAAFEPQPRRDAPPVKAPPLPRPKRKRVQRWLCVQCGQAADDPQDLCEPVPVS